MIISKVPKVIHKVESLSENYNLQQFSKKHLEDVDTPMEKNRKSLGYEGLNYQTFKRLRYPKLFPLMDESDMIVEANKTAQLIKPIPKGKNKNMISIHNL